MRQDRNTGVTETRDAVGTARLWPLQRPDEDQPGNITAMREGKECQALTREHIMAECPRHASSIMVNKIPLHLEMVIDHVGLARKQSLLMCSACTSAHIVITYTFGDQWLVHKGCLGASRVHPDSIYHTQVTQQNLCKRNWAKVSRL